MIKKKEKKVNFAAIEKKWQGRWEKARIFLAKDGKGKKYYVLDMFPYPSGEGLHMGHAFVFSLGDVYARFKRMQGYNVLYPVGYDSLGLPAENAAIKAGIHPREYTKKSIANFMKQEKAMGWSYDWNRVVNTSGPEYYKWDQWIFLQMLKKNLAYRKKAAVNYCEKCQTVLANEQVVGGKCWRHEEQDVEIKHLEQWFFKITNYTEQLLKGLDKLNWPERAKLMQRNWIGRSEGVDINFSVNNKKWPIFTTRIDTVFGVTFMVISAQHPKLMGLVTTKQKKAVEVFLKKIKSVSEKELEDLEKQGVFTGSYAVNPLTNEKIPVYVGNFVVADYGSGMVMAVPGHDQRDYDFAKKYKLPVKEVIKGGNIKERAYAGEGKLVNSGKFNGLNSEQAKEKIADYLEKLKLGKRAVNYKLRDWLISRQRYWGTPIPIIYCKKCGIIPVEESQLPVKLPEKVKFGKGNPLLTDKNWTNVKCPKCKSNARRETDTMDTFVNSSWYYLRYCDNKNKKVIFDKKKVSYWCPVDHYTGGPEHITMHLIYIRFYTKFLRDLGLLNFDEPALKYFTQGIVHGSDGEKMSKSRGNVVEPLESIKKYGADSLRLYLVSNSSPENDFVWNEGGVEGSLRFVNKVVSYFSKVKTGKSDEKIESIYNKAVKEITEDVENFRYNLAVIKIRGLFEKLGEKESREVLSGFLKMLSIFCPHVCEELWSKLRNKGFISVAAWPVYEARKINEKFEEQDKANEKLVSDIRNIINILKNKGKQAKKVYVYVLPKEIEFYNEGELSKKLNIEVQIFAVNDKAKFDPQNFASKTKPRKPALYVE